MPNLAGYPVVASAALTLAACGARTGLLDLSSASSSPDDAGIDAGPITPSSCPALPPIPAPPSRPPGEACTFSPTSGSSTPVLAAIAGSDLVALLPNGTTTSFFHFGASESVIDRSLVSRGDYLGAMIVSLPEATTLAVEFVLMRVDGTILVHHADQFDTETFGGSAGIVGNAAGTFAFSVGMGDIGKVWVAFAQGSIVGPFDDVTLPYGGLNSAQVEPDAQARFLVLPARTNNTADLYWLDPCHGTQTVARLPVEGDAVGWGASLWGMTRSGQLSSETADGMTALAHAPLSQQAGFWDFVPPGVAMFSVPPFPSAMGATGNLLVIDAATLEDHLASLSYPEGLSVVPPDGWISEIGDSNNPAGFGLDSAGRVTMFLSDNAGLIHLELTSNGSDWTPIGEPVLYDTMFAPSYSLAFAEASGTYVVKGLDVTTGLAFWQAVRPASGVQVTLQGPGQVGSDGGCVSALVSESAFEVINAVTGSAFTFGLPAQIDPGAWVSTWIPGDDARLPAP
jgi:hypothetical protein